MSEKDYKVLAIDFGASSGRAIIGNFKNDKIEIEEIHRFSNDPVKLNNTLYWDFLRLVFEIKKSIIKSKKYGEIKSILYLCNLFDLLFVIRTPLIMRMKSYYVFLYIN